MNAERVDQIKELQAEAADILAELNLEGAGEMIEGDYRISWSTGVRFNEQLARSVLTKKEQALAEKTVLDSAKVKALFATKYAKCQKPNASPTVKIEVVA